MYRLNFCHPLQNESTHSLSCWDLSTDGIKLNPSLRISLRGREPLCLGRGPPCRAISAPTSYEVGSALCCDCTTVQLVPQTNPTSFSFSSPHPPHLPHTQVLIPKAHSNKLPAYQSLQVKICFLGHLTTTKGINNKVSVVCGIRYLKLKLLKIGACKSDNI